MTAIDKLQQRSSTGKPEERLKETKTTLIMKGILLTNMKLPGNLAAMYSFWVTALLALNQAMTLSIRDLLFEESK
jgi:hypothetical protein